MADNIQLWSDFSIFGIHLAPFVIKKSYGFSEKKGLLVLILDIDNEIKDTAKYAQLIPLWRSEDASKQIYILPSSEAAKGFLPSSELLHRLGLSVVAPPNSLTAQALLEKFKNALGDDYPAFHHFLFTSTLIGRNHLGESVHDSFFGRFVTGADGIERYDDIDANPRFLLATDLESSIDEASLIYCMQSYLLTHAEHNTTTLEDFISICMYPVVKSLEIEDYIELSQVAKTKLIHKGLNNPLQSISAKDALFDACGYVVATFLKNRRPTIGLLRQLFNDYFSIQKIIPLNSANNGLPYIPMRIATALAFIANPNKKFKKVFSDSISSLTVLAAIGDSQVVEQRKSLEGKIRLFAENNSNFDIAVKDNYKAIDSFDCSVSIYPQGVNYVEIAIPIINKEGKLLTQQNTDNYAFARIINTLQKRDSNGRSVFLIGGEPAGKLGDSTWFYIWLQGYYRDVSVFDISEKLFLGNKDPEPLRLIIVGEEKNPRPESLTSLIENTANIKPDLPINIIETFEDLFTVCDAVITKEISKSYVIKHYDDGVKLLNERQEINIFRTLNLVNQGFNQNEISPLVDNKKPIGRYENPFVDYEDTEEGFINLRKNPINYLVYEYNDEPVASSNAESKTSSTEPKPDVANTKTDIGTKEIKSPQESDKADTTPTIDINKQEIDPPPSDSEITKETNEIEADLGGKVETEPTNTSLDKDVATLAENDKEATQGTHENTDSSNDITEQSQQPSENNQATENTNTDDLNIVSDKQPDENLLENSAIDDDTQAGEIGNQGDAERVNNADANSDNSDESTKDTRDDLLENKGDDMDSDDINSESLESMDYDSYENEDSDNDFDLSGEDNQLSEGLPGLDELGGLGEFDDNEPDF